MGLSGAGRFSSQTQAAVSAPAEGNLWVIPESQNQYEVPEGINRNLIIDAMCFGKFLNVIISTEHPSRKEILIFPKNNNN